MERLWFDAAFGVVVDMLMLQPLYYCTILTATLNDEVSKRFETGASYRVDLTRVALVALVIS